MASTTSMTDAQAASFVIPLGPFRHSSLAVVAVRHPAYVLRLADGDAPECRPGTAFHDAVAIVASRILDSLVDGAIDAETFRACQAGGARWNAEVDAKWRESGGFGDLDGAAEAVEAKGRKGKPASKARQARSLAFDTEGTS